VSATNQKSFSILLVGDNGQYAGTLANHDRAKEGKWIARTTGDFAGARTLLKNERTDAIAVFADVSGGSAAELLRLARDSNPNALRFFVYRKGESDALREATGLAHRYIEDPADGGDIAFAIHQVLKTHLRIRRKAVAEVVRDTKQLHVNTAPLQELLKTVNDPECDIDCLAKIVRQHPTAVASILQVANTAFFGSAGGVETLEEALQLLGMDFVRNLAITELAKKQLALSPTMQEIANAILQHSIEASQYAYRMRQFDINVKLIQNLCSLTLLHDLGKLVLLARYDRDYADVLSHSVDSETPCWRVEQNKLGCDHAAVGGFLFAMWGMPEMIIRAVTWHHAPHGVCGDEFCEVSLLHFANAASHAISASQFYGGDMINEELAQRHGLPKDYVIELREMEG